MSVPVFTYSVQMNTNVGTPNVVVTDTTNYTGFDVTLMLAIIQESNNGVPFYTNANWNTPSWASPDLNGGNNTLTFQYNLPLSPNTNQVPLGTYTFVIIPYYNGAAQPAVTVTVPYTFSLPVPSLNIGYSLSAGQLTAADNTDYSDVTGATLVSVVRTMTLTYPQGSGQSAITTPNQLITIGANTPYQFWTGDYQLNVSSVCTFLVNGNNVVVTIKGYTSSGNISAEANLCNLRGCIFGLFQKWIGYCENNAAQAEFYGNLWQMCEGYWADIIMCRECGNQKQIQCDIDAIQEILNSNGCGCGCPEPSSDVPIQIFPMNTVPLNCVVAAGTDISVAVNTVGNTTTYTVSLSSGFISTINTIEGDITSINASIVTLTNDIAAIVSSKYLKLYELPTSVVTSTTTQTTLATYSVAANSLVNNDEVVIKAYVLNGTESGGSIVPAGDIGTVTLQVTDNSSYVINAAWAFAATNWAQDWEVRIIRVSATTVRVKIILKITGFADIIVAEIPLTMPIQTVGSLATYPLVITLLGQSVNVSAGMTLQQFEVEQYKA